MEVGGREGMEESCENSTYQLERKEWLFFT